MKKTLLATSIGLVTLGGAIFAGTATLAHAQNISLQQIIQLFISLGIIPADKAAAAEAAVASLNAGGPTSTSTVTTTTTVSSLTLSTDTATPLAETVVASNGANNNEADGVTALVFDLTNNSAGAVTVNSVQAHFASTGNGSASAATAYLYSGPTEIASASVNNNLNTIFQNINYSIPANTTLAFTVKMDVKNANASPVTITASVSSIAAVNSFNGSIGVSGSAAGNPLTVINAAPLFTLVGTPTITESQTPLANNHSTTTLTARFTLNIQAVGDNYTFGTITEAPTFNFGIYENGIKVFPNVTSFANWSVPSSGVITTGLPSSQGGQAFTLQQNNSVQIPVTFTFANSGSLSSGSYAVGLESINYTNSANFAQTANYMSGNVTWRTPVVSLTGTGSTQTNTQPSIHLYGSSGSQTSDSSITVNSGNTFTISGTPQGIQGLSYYYGTGNPTSGYYNRAFFFDPLFNNSCSNNDASSQQWVMTCTAPVVTANASGAGKFYVQIYANGQAYTSNVVTVNVITPQTTQPVQPTATETITPSNQTVSSGQGVSVNFTYPSNTVKAQLYLSCPSGVTLGAAKGNLSSCNTITDVTNSAYAAFTLLNNTSQSQSVVPNYYVYLSSNPNYALGVSSNIVVTPAAQTNTLPALSLSQSSVSFSANQGDTQYQQKSFTFTNTGNTNVSYTISVPNQPAWLNTGYTTSALIASPSSPNGIGASLNPNGLSVGTYSTNIILTGNFSGSPLTIPVSVTILPQATTASTNPVVTVSSPTISSGSTDVISLTMPSNTVSAQLTLLCPSGVSAKSFNSMTSTVSSGELCNTQQNIDVHASGEDVSLTNTTAGPLTVTPKFQVYLLSNPNSAVNSLSSIVVNPAPQTSPLNTISVTSPGTGETLTQGQNYTIRWSTSNLAPSVTAAYILLTDVSGNPITTIASSVPVTQGSYVWNVGSNVFPLLTQGTYKIKVALYYSNVSTSLNPFALSNAFTLSAPQTTTTPALSLPLSASTLTLSTSTQLSGAQSGVFVGPIQQTINIVQPNGSTQYQVRGALNLQWTSTALSSPLTANLVSSNSSYSIFLGLSTSTNSYSWTIPSNVVNGNYQVSITSGSVHTVSNSFGVTSTAITTQSTPSTPAAPVVTTSAAQPTNVTLLPNQDYYFHVTSGTVTLGDITNAGGINASTNLTPVDSLFFMPNNPPASTDSASAIYFPYNGTSASGWVQSGNASGFTPSTQAISTYFIIRKGANSSATTLALPSSVSYDGATVQNGQPRPWNQQSIAKPSNVVASVISAIEGLFGR